MELQETMMDSEDGSPRLESKEFSRKKKEKKLKRNEIEMDSYSGPSENSERIESGKKRKKSQNLRKKFHYAAQRALKIIGLD